MTMKFELPQLPYPKDSLAPYISAETLEFHHERHHAAYLKKLNELVRGNRYAEMSLEDIIRSSGSGPLLNNAAQHWNHSFYWNCMMPESRKPTGAIANAIKQSFKNLDNLKKQFNNAAVNQFGSGWAWLVLKEYQDHAGC
jgi:Fe-Mn family superoxide dismutase